MSGETHDRSRNARPWASSPCSMPELDPDRPAHEAARLRGRSDVAMWRKAERRAQLERRRTLSVEQRRDCGARIAGSVLEVIADAQGITVSLYWPIRGEPDLRDLIDEITRRGGHCALPVVTERNQPLEFRAWKPGDRLERGFWNIPVPSDGAKVVPDVVVAPVVAFDDACYRLGYGGGYFDRTLSVIPGEPRVLGVGYEQAKIDTIYPQSHDIPMHAIVTENGVCCATRRR